MVRVLVSHGRTVCIVATVAAWSEAKGTTAVCVEGVLDSDKHAGSIAR